MQEGASPHRCSWDPQQPQEVTCRPVGATEPDAQPQASCSQACRSLVMALCGAQDTAGWELFSF